MSDIEDFIQVYAGDDQRIRFAWNGYHASEFEDANQEFRRQVIEQILKQPEKAPVTLLRDLFRAETAWSREAWCIDRRVRELASLLLTLGRAAVVEDFLSGRAQSFDAYCACETIVLESEIAEEIYEEIARWLAVEMNAVRRKHLQEGLKFFAKYTARGVH